MALQARTHWNADSKIVPSSGAFASTQASERLHKRVSKLTYNNLPKCTACQFGKQTSRAIPGKRSMVIKD